MKFKNLVMLSGAFSIALATSAFAVQSDGEQVVHHAVHKRHLVKNIKPNTASDADSEAAPYVSKPQTVPEYFGHGTGSDGSMPQ